MSYFEKGNALFMVLIAIALFAALSFAITNSGSSGKTIDDETIALDAAQIVQFSNMLAVTTQRLMILNDCSESELNFDNDVYSGYTNGPRDSNCSLFHPSGGGLTMPDFTQTLGYGADMGVFYITGSNRIDGVGSTCASAGCSDLAYYLTFARTNEASLKICNAINKKLGIAGSAPPEDVDINVGNKFVGSFSAAAALKDAGGLLNGKRAGCLNETGGGGYIFYQVLVAR